ncbi:hypothetical protein CBN_0260 [Clostridium botulinum NCTC 2916]|nr:hypothetical protein CBN_0260 [Clostridium botulinum NCTC 2916]
MDYPLYFGQYLIQKQLSKYFWDLKDTTKNMFIVDICG